MPDTSEHQATGAALMKFLDWAIEKGYLKASTGQGIKTSVKDVLTHTEGAETWQQVDLRSLDVEDTLSRYEVKRATNFSTGSLNTYKTRFRRAVGMFADFRDDPSNWKPPYTSRPTTRSNAAETGTSESAVSRKKVAIYTEPAESNFDQAAMSVGLPSGGGKASPLITYPFPLRDGVVISVNLPPDLTGTEAARLSRFIESLSIDDTDSQRTTVPERDTRDDNS